MVKFAHQILTQDFYARSALQVAPELVGCVLRTRLVDGREIVGVIIETEAYLQTDPASHSYKGLTQRNAPMFGPPGLTYVYLIYGMYHCLNVVTGREGEGEAVLIRAIDFSMSGEHVSVGAGPGKLCRFLNINRSHNRLPVFDLESPLQILSPKVVVPSIVQTTRIGLRHGRENPWRWFWSSHPSVSKRG